MATPLSREQEAFLKECNLEFSERYTTADLEFKNLFESDIPDPPVVFPWYGKSRFNRDRPTFSRDRDDYSRERDGFMRNRDNRRGYSNHYNRDRDHSEGSSNHRYRPY
ncbi:hypothetical protein HHI36_004335 [Cryptolaemus montrouzieri]|uniref:Uncharacterized protein n=1 Tax=Cryptolaemus montrouzieri TaxID=559131 RepID=A0ABD2NQV9_9CUCU